MKPTILILAFTDLSSDPRVRRQILALKAEYEIIVVGVKSPDIPDIKFISYEIERKNLLQKISSAVNLLTRQYKKVYWKNKYIYDLEQRLTGERYDLILANDIETLPLAIKLKDNNPETKIVLDAHEYAPKEFEDVFYWKVLYSPYKDYLCRTYLSKTDYNFTVCRGIAREYEKQYGSQFDVLTNAAKYCDEEICPTDNNDIKMVCHGIANESRKIENLIEVAKRLEKRFSLDLYLVGNQEYIKKLKEMIQYEERIRILSPVPYEKIHQMLRGYDIGFFLLEPVNFNYKMALPNKLFEFVQARLAIAIGPSPEMKYFIDKYNCGIVTTSFNIEEMADALNHLTGTQIDRMKENTCIMAINECAEKNMMKLKDVISTLLERR